MRGIKSNIPTTHERELETPVDLCLEDGRRLHPSAIGWSRRPLHRANLKGAWGRTKRWDYWALLAGDHVVTITYADLDYLGIVAIDWFDLRTGDTGGRQLASPGAWGIALPDSPGSEPLRFHGRGVDLAIVDDAHGTSIDASWRERGGSTSSVAARVALADGHESLNVVIPWSERLFQYTSKHQARPVSGTLVRAGRTIRFEDAPGGAFGVLDVGRGRWPYRTRWNWGGGAGRATNGGALIGLQFGGIWTVGTGATENGILIDGRLTKLGSELEWDYDWNAPLRPWRVRARGGEIDLVLTPRYDRHVKVNALLLGTEVHQVFGTWRGTVRAADGIEYRLDALAGFAEESRSRW